MLQALLCCSSDDLFLMIPIKINKIVAVSGNAHEKTSVFIRIFLSLPKSLRVDDIELNMMAAEAEVGLDELRHFFQSSLPAQN